MKYTLEEIREAAETNEHLIPLRVRDILRDYASLRQALDEMKPTAWWYPVGHDAAITTDETLVEHEPNAPWKPLFELPPNDQVER